MATKKGYSMKTKIKRAVKTGAVAVVAVGIARYAVRAAASKGIAIPGASLIG